MSVAPPRIRPGTVAGLLRLRAAEIPGREAYLFLADGEVEGERLTWEELDRRACTIALALRESLRPGDRALLLYPPGLDFVAAFFGCLYAGVVAVPAYPPRPHDRSLDRLRAVARDAEPRAALTTGGILAAVSAGGGAGWQDLAGRAPELAAARWIATDEFRERAPAAGFDLPEPDPEALAFLQYTSGSTATPKGVMVTHANLLHNEAAIGAAFRQDEDSVVVGWLPLYHDMGLIGNVLQPLHAGSRCVLMAPAAFLQRPRRWLEAIGRYGGTTSGGPDFAYELCVRRIPPEQRDGLDLRSWRVAFNGAEPVRAATLARFSAAFAPCGFDPAAFYPCYGLAEATLFVSGGAADRPPRLEPVTGARPLVSCGHAWCGQRIAIADPETGAELPPEMEGEIWVAGPSVAAGYWRNPEATQRDFQAYLDTGDGPSGPFLRTGDLGVLREGELFVTGRIKDLVILRGRNHYPQDLERTAEAAHPELRPGGAAAFAVDAGGEGGEERLVIVVEVERRRRDDLPAIAEAVRRAIAEEHEVQAGEVVLVRPGGVPKTSSGKVRRSACRAAWQAGELPVLERSALASAAPGEGAASDPAGLATLPEEDRRAAVERFLRSRAAAALGITAEAIDPARTLAAYGLDSLAALDLKGSVEAALGVPLPLGELLAGAGTARLADALARSMAEHAWADPESVLRAPAGAGAVPESVSAVPVRVLAMPGSVAALPAAVAELSFGERALWFLDRLAPAEGAYNIAVAARVHGDLDTEALRRAFAALTDRHEALRTVFPLVGDGPSRLVLPAGTEAVDFREVGDVPALAEWLVGEAWRPFDLAAGPLLRVRIVRGTEEETVLLLSVHHLVADFWSLAVMARDLAGLSTLPTPRSASDFARWQTAMLASPRGETLWESWRQRLAGVPDLNLPTDRPRPPVQTWRGLSRAAVLPADEATSVRALSDDRGATLFALLLAAFQAQLGRYAGQDDFAVGTPTAGRGAPEWESTVGYLVNPVALRADLAGEPGFGELVERARRTAVAALEGADFPFALLAERLRPARDPARPPIFQVLLALHGRRPGDPPGLAAFALREDGARLPFAGLELESVRLAHRPAQFEISLSAAELPDGGIGLSIEVNADLFDGATAERMLGHFRTLLTAAAADPATRLSALPVLTAAERAQLAEWNDTAPPPGEGEGTLYGLVAAQALLTPDAEAMVGAEERVTYRELLARAGRVAGFLRGLGAGPEERIGLCLRRTPDMVAALLGILQTGAAYVPLDPAYPQERLDFMLSDSGVGLLWTEKALADRFAFFRGTKVSAEEAVVLSPSSGGREGMEEGAGGEGLAGEGLAYVIYTSGSTGRPKGVGIEHRSAVALVEWALGVFAPEELRGVLAATSVCFDLSIFEIFVPLAAGGRVILAPDVLALPRLAARGEVTLVNTVPSPMGELVHGPLPVGLRTVCLAGEALKPELVERVYAHPQIERVINLYGPSEDTTYSTWTVVPRGAAVTIGRPIAGTRAWVLGRQGEELPVGVPGELCLGGAGLARGYLGRPELTAERFIPDPFGPGFFGDAAPRGGSRLYRTGDRARLSAGGAIEFLGRLDRQVKVRGFRIELGEIEAALESCPAVGEAAVVLRADGAAGEPRLVGYLVAAAESGRDAAAAAAAFLRERLPAAFIPSAWVVLDAFPRSPNGKVDRAALARLAAAEAADGAASAETAPRTPVEEILAGLFATLLGLERVGIHEDFFSVGGHSLLAARAVSRISRLLGADLPISALFQAPTVAALAKRVAEQPAGAGRALRGAPRAADVPLPLSFGQQRLWFLDRMEPGTAVYNMPGALDIGGPLPIPALAAALSAVVARHEPLRTVYAVEGGEPVQRIAPPSPQPLPVVDLAALPAALREAATARLGRSEAQAPFDLARGPVCRALLLRLEAEKHRLLITLHHIAADGWSLGLLLDELATHLGGLSLPALPVRYADWAAWQRAWMEGEESAGQIAWWRERLTGLPVLDLPADHPRPAVHDPRGGSRARSLPAALEAAVARLARQAGCTVFMVLLGAFQALLARLTGEDLIPVGSPVANRLRLEAEPLIGLFVNTLVLAVRAGDDPAFDALLARVRMVCLGAYAHQEVPFERLVQELQPERDLGRNPLFQVMLVLDEALPARAANDLTLTPRRADSGTARFDLLLAVTPAADGGWELLTEHAAALFEAVTIDRLLQHFAALLAGAAAAPDVRLSSLPLLSAAERAQLEAWNDSPAAVRRGEATLHGLVAAQALRTPDAEAIVGEKERITYRELIARSGRVAGILRGLGAGPEVRVGLCLRRTPDMIAAILGVLAAGGAYVPLDPGYPQERLGFMLADSGAGLLWTEKALADRFAFFQGTTVLADELSSSSPSPGGWEGMGEGAGGEGHLAYIIYTSGSTGRPKGVGIEHRSAVVMVEWALGVFPAADLRGVLASTSVCFDLSIFELFVPLAAGGRVILAAGILDLPQLADRNEVTLINTVPTPMAELVRGRLPASLRTVNLAGEALKPDLVAKIYAHPQVERVVNLYGPSEATTYSTWTVVPRGAAVTIGRPVAGTQAWVLGRWGEALPAGVIGELCLGGAGLARGYLGRPELTAERFVPDPLSGGEGARLYRTGDRVRRRPDGEIEFLGRFDHQVKVRGQRIELGEIEAALARCPAVAEAVVMLREDGASEARLVGYLVPAAEGETAAAAAEDHLREWLPPALVPAVWVVLPELPRSPNGKIDRRALPAPRSAEPAALTAPRTPEEELLAGLFREILGLERIGVHDNFFALGGHSLLAVRLAFRIAEIYGTEVAVAAVFEAPTVAGMAARLAPAPRAAAVEPLRASAAPENGYPLSSAQQRLWFFDLLEPGSAAYNLSIPLRLAGRLDIPLLGRAVAEIVRRHEPLRTVYVHPAEAEGPADTEPVQIVLPPGETPLLSRVSLAGLPVAARHAAATAILVEEAALPFDLQRGPVARFVLIELEEEEHLLAAVFHHIATDGWSLGIFSRELAAIYTAFAAGRPSPLPELPIRYADFALAERRGLAGGAFAGQLAYWRDQLAGIPVLELPADRPRAPRPSPRGASWRVELPAGFAAGLSASGGGITPFMAFLAGFAALLSRLSGQDDFGIGVPSAGRSRAETEELIGFFVNTLVLRTRLDGDPPFLEVARRVRDTAVAAQANQEVPFERLVEELLTERIPGVSPLFQVMLAFLSDPAGALRIPGLSVSLVELEATHAKFDLTLSIHEWEGCFQGWLQYRTDLFEASTIERMAGWLLSLLAGAAADPACPLWDLPLLTAAEARQLGAGAGTVQEHLEDVLHRAFEERARVAPEAPAVLAGAEILTCAELEARANRLARHLLALGLAPEAPVAVCLEPSSPDLLTAFLAVLKAGGVYLPLDPAYPPERMRDLLADAGAAVLISRGALADRLPLAGSPGRTALLLDRDAAAIAAQDASSPSVEVDPRALAYLIYTSGSTGRPKGVGVPHGAAAAHFAAVRPIYGLGEGDRLMQFASPGFDVSVEQLLAHIPAGAALVLRGAPLGVREWMESIGELGLSFINLPTAFWRRWVGEVAVAADLAELPSPMRLSIVGGEEMLAESVRAWSRTPLATAPLLNGYGPTETVITATMHEVRPEDGDAGPVSIGLPIPGRSAWVLDRAGNLQPVGVPGELWLAGPLARGYLGRPDLTAERFVPDPFSGRPGARLYRTGDRVRRRAGGDLEFLGRLDAQVKVRGFRIEPGEIEAALASHPGVREAAVSALTGTDGDKILAAYVVPAEPGSGSLPADLRDFLRERLPAYMVPTAWSVLSALPLNAHGKVDRSALPPPSVGGAPEEEGTAAPETPEQELLTGLFAELLGAEHVQPEDDFFELGGHSLLATQLVSRLRAVLGVTLPLAAVFETPTAAGLARRLEAARRASGPPPPLVREPAGEAPLSFAQQRLWFLHQLEPESAAYNVPGALRLRGPLRPAVLARALGEIVRRHEALRTVFAESAGHAVQVILPPAAWDPALPMADLGALPEASGVAEALRLLGEEAVRPFDLARGPLLRVLLLRLGAEDEDHLLAVAMHHIVSDAWSLGIVLRELTAFYNVYNASAAEESARLPELPIQYADFARWQRRWLTGEVLERELAYWRRVLAGAPEVLELPYDRPRSAAVHRAGRRPFALSGEMLAAVRALGRRDGWTLFMTFLAGFEALLARYSGEEDTVVGSPIANRNHLETEGLVGFFTNTLALRLDLSGDPTFWEIGRRVRAVALDAYAHQDLPFEKLVEELAPERRTGLNPLFQVMLVVQRPPVEALALPGVTAELLDVEPMGPGEMAKFDLTLFLFEGAAGTMGSGTMGSGTMEYSRDLFDPATVDRMLASFRTLLAGALASPGLRLSQLPLLAAAEREELIAWACPPVPQPEPRCVHEMVAAQAASRPEAEAVVCGDVRLTFRELVARARRLARRLSALGVGPDVPVGIFLKRSPGLLVSLLAVLEAGGAYLPLDPSYPRERLRLMLEDAGAPVVLTDRASAAMVPGGVGTVLVVVEEALERGPGDEGPLASGVTPENLVYLVYTSGSTGRPKGVAMTHGAISAMLAWQLRTSAAGSGRTLQFTSLSFDVSFQEIFSAWAAGGAVVLVSEDVRRDPPALLALLVEERVERLFLPFVALQQLAVAAVSGPLPASLREVMSAGEQLYVTPQVAELFSRLPGAALHNHYGPSETHAVTWLALTGDPSLWPERPAIGGPVDHARVFLLDRWLRPVPGAVPGEIWVGGAGLARGYQARPDLTAERFLPDPFDEVAGWEPGGRLYRTGDLARRRPDGTLEFLGRGDAQVKVRGQRIEPAEVEAALARHPAVLQAAVVVKGETHGDSVGARRLMACVVFRDGMPVPAAAEIKTFLAETLPDPMIPSAWARLDALPLTPSGKLDRRALARIAPEEVHRAFEPPRTPAEEILAGIWRDVLGVERVDLHDDFFELGGHSLLATQVASRLREAFRVELPLRRLFEAPTLEGMAAAAVAAVAAGGESPAPSTLGRLGRSAGDDLPLSFAQERLWFLDRLQPGAAYDIPLALRAAGRLDAAALAAALGEVVRRHEVLRTVYADRDGAPAQVVLAAAGQPLPVVDLGELPEAERRDEAARLAAAEAAWVFELTTGPLLRTVLVALGPAEHLLLVNMHHIVSDGWSLGVLVREIRVLYAAALHGEPSPLPEPAIQYADFAEWQRDWLAGEVLDRQLAWWRQRLAGAPAALEVPADRPRPPVQSWRGAEHRFRVGATLAHRLAALGREEGATPFMVLAAGLFTLLARLTGQRDLVIGSPIANRNRIETEGLIGFFVNNLALRADLSRAASFRDLLRQVREASLGAYAHQDLPFEKLVEELHPDRDLSRSPLFQVAVALQNAPLPAAELAGLTLEPQELPAAVAKFDLSFVFAETDADGGLAGVLQYATDLFDATTAARLAGHLEVLLSGLAAQPRARLDELPLLTAGERHQALAEWNDTREAVWSLGEKSAGALLHQLFEAQADLRPDALALVFEAETMSYGELEAAANRLAYLLLDLGTGMGEAVGIWMERSPDMVAAVLAVLKAGGTYVPLDPAWPAERAEVVLASAGARAVLTRASLLPAVQEIQWRLPRLTDVVCLDVREAVPPPEPLDPESVRALWDFVAESAVDQITAGGFVSSFTGEPFSEAEVDEYRDRVLALAAPWLRPAARVLEIGCGAGLILWEMARRAGFCAGLDPSPRTQERNREHAQAAGITNVELAVGFAHEAAEIFAGEAGSFDLIVMASTVQFFPGPLYLERVVQDALGLLAPGGALLVADVPDARRQGELRRALVEAGAPAKTGRAAELWLDEDFFHDLAALPGAERASVLHRAEGFANELHFRYDVLVTRREGGEVGRERHKRLWTGWHIDRQSGERPPAAAVSGAPEAIAYVMHTSGSTGAPKGIAVQHTPAVELVRWVNRTFGVGPGDRLLFVTSPAFDLSVWDLFGTLGAGAALQIAAEEALRDPQRLARLLLDEPVTLWDSAPAALQQLAPFFPETATAESPLRLVLLSGDWIPVPLPDRVRAAFPAARVISLGGTTEATVWSNWYPIGKVDPRWPSIPYGRPIANVRYHVLDEAFHLCPIGVPGDLLIGGRCLSIGYTGQPDLTAARFVPDPFTAEPGARLYRSGDRARHGRDGNLEFLGRRDQQVKVRGFRIELGEIEAALARHPAVREAVVAVREETVGGAVDQRLVGYVVPATPAPAGAELRAFLRETLPEYMVPWTFVMLDAMPVTANGKLDRAALPAPQQRATAAVAPRNALEQEIAAAWREVLGVGSIGVEDNFFEVGGSSLLLGKLQARLRRSLGRDIAFVDLFRHPTIESLARSLAEAPAPEALAEQARARTGTRRERLGQLQKTRTARTARTARTTTDE